MLSRTKLTWFDLWEATARNDVAKKNVALLKVWWMWVSRCRSARLGLICRKKLRRWFCCFWLIWSHLCPCSCWCYDSVESSPSFQLTLAVAPSFANIQANSWFQAKNSADSNQRGFERSIAVLEFSKRCFGVFSIVWDLSWSHRDRKQAWAHW